MCQQLGSALAVKRSPTFENIHAHRFRYGVQRSYSLESGVLPVTPRGNALTSKFR
jgi:hypothetical protein